MKIIFIFLLFIAFKINAQPTVIYLVRHAEKITTDATNKDPLLTNDGIKRAKILSKKFKKIDLAAIYSTNYLRNKLTAEPVAKRKNLILNIYNPKDLTAFVIQIKNDFKGKNVLVVGHSNSVIETIKAFGVQPPIDTIKEDEYNYFFKVIVNTDDTVLVSYTKYGK